MLVMMPLAVAIGFILDEYCGWEGESASLAGCFFAWALTLIISALVHANL